MITQSTVVFGAMYYEFIMQVRRRGLWITFLLIFILWVLLTHPNSTTGINILLHRYTLSQLVGFWTFNYNRLLPVGFGCLVADRLVRDYRTKADELFITTPGYMSARLTGKYFGSLFATIVPFFLLYIISTGYVAYTMGSALVFPLALKAFVVITLPGLCCITAFALACPMIMWIPLFQFCFIAYWFWGNLLPPSIGIPTLTDTLLTPIGEFMAVGFFQSPDISIQATPIEGVESLLLLLGIALLVMVVLGWFIKWRGSRQ